MKGIKEQSMDKGAAKIPLQKAREAVMAARKGGRKSGLLLGGVVGLGAGYAIGGRKKKEADLVEMILQVKESANPVRVPGGGYKLLTKKKGPIKPQDPKKKYDPNRKTSSIVSLVLQVKEAGPIDTRRMLAMTKKFPSSTELQRIKPPDALKLPKGDMKMPKP